MVLAGLPTVLAQSRTTWRRVGNSAVDRSLAGVATGPVDRVWYAANGALLIHTASNHIFETNDFETWHNSAAAVQAEISRSAATLPEAGARVRSATPGSAVLYAVGKFVYRSENGGVGWDNLTSFRGFSILGANLRDLAVSPSNEDEIAAAGDDGVFRSMDGGKSWGSLNQSLPNLPVSRLLSVPSGEQGTRAVLNDGTVVEWQPGQKIAWSPVDDPGFDKEMQLRQLASVQRAAPVTALASMGDYLYTGTGDGRITVSTDGGATQRPYQFGEGGMVERFWVDPNDPRVAVAVLGQRPASLPSAIPVWHVARTQNGGQFWDDLTANLPDVAVHGVTADRATGAIYVATDRGLFMTYTDLQSLGAPPQWTPLATPVQDATEDVLLDPQGNQIFTAIDGFGVYSTLAPHRQRDPRVVSTADLVARATAPGSLISVLGARVQTARSGDLQIPVLTSSDTDSQLQVPFEATGSSVALAFDGANGHTTLPAVPLQATAPAIFADPDGSPVLIDAESGQMLDAMNPAHSRSRVQILATGLGRVKPDWPTGLPGPAENPPAVVAPVQAYLDRQPVEVTRAVLAPYIGFYLIEIEVPKIVNYGPAELYLDVNGQASNRVRIYIQP